MIVSCPSCNARYRLNSDKVDSKRITLRCAKCRQIFKVEAGSQDQERILPSEQTSQVLVAHGDRLLCDAVGEILKQGRISYEVANDGHVALDVIKSIKPDAVLIDVALPGIFAFELIQKVRDDVSLDSVKLILLSSVYNKMAYKRRPDNLYGADDYIEKHHLPDDLIPMLNRLKLGLTSATGKQIAEQQVHGEPAVENKDIPGHNYVNEMNQRIQAAEERESVTDILDEDVARARRLARIIVSDIALYNHDRVEEGIRSGNFIELFAEELAEGQRLFAKRISEEVRSREDFIKAAIKRFLEQKILDMQGK